MVRKTTLGSTPLSPVDGPSDMIGSTFEEGFSNLLAAEEHESDIKSKRRMTDTPGENPNTTGNGPLPFFGGAGGMVTFFRAVGNGNVYRRQIAKNNYKFDNERR